LDDPGVKSVHAVLVEVSVSVVDAQSVQDAPEIVNPVDCTVRHPVECIVRHFSSWRKMVRALAWWLRFKSNLRSSDSKQGPLSVEEIQAAEILILKKAQRESFGTEILHLRKWGNFPNSSALKSLCPFLDQDDLLRVGGRLIGSHLGSGSQVILHADHSVARAIIMDIHNKAHVGVEWVLSLVREKFWLVKARRVIKGLIKVCVLCRKLHGKPCVQQMSEVPDERLDYGGSAFSNVGIDVFGPFFVKLKRSTVKRYGCIFTCLVMRAVHIEILDTMETDSFLNAFRRFVARRGMPVNVFSDNGTNFVGAESELRKCIQELSPTEIEQYASKNGITWHFNPPLASHMGGIWERMIRTIRKVLRAILGGKVLLTDEILATLFCEVESIVNSRPLTKVSDDVSDPAPLTPNHLLILKEGPCKPPGNFGTIDMYKRRWRHVQHLANQFWKKWVRFYLPELQIRHKWTKVKSNVSVGDLVLVMEENTPRNVWPLALIEEVNMGRDGFVRSVKLKTASSRLVRPICKIVLLEGVNDVR
jgi:hypothetical protein